MHNLQYLHDKKQKLIFILLSLVNLIAFGGILALAFVFKIPKNVLNPREIAAYSVPLAFAVLAWIILLGLVFLLRFKCIICKPLTTVSYAIMGATTLSFFFPRAMLRGKTTYVLPVLAAILIILMLCHLLLLNVYDKANKNRRPKDIVAFLLTGLVFTLLLGSSYINAKVSRLFYLVYWVALIFALFQLLLTLHDIYYARKRYVFTPIVNLVGLGLNIFLMVQIFTIKMAKHEKMLLAFILSLALLSAVGFVYTLTDIVKRNHTRKHQQELLGE